MAARHLGMRRIAAAVVAAGLALTAAPASATAAERGQGSGWDRGGARYVALGDSFASGEGLRPYELGTDTATNACHRSVDRSYPALLADDGRRGFRRLASVACSGALTGALLADLPDRSDEPPQLTALGRKTRTVTLTIGGNDLGFAPVLADCVYTPVPLPPAQAAALGSPGCERRLDAGVTARTALLGAPASTPVTGPIVPVARLISAIHARAPRARIYVTGYPQLFGTRFDSPAGCRVGQLGQVPLFVSAGDVRWIRGKVAALNDAIASGVAQARAEGVRIRYVDVAEDFTGHNLCDARRPWVNGLVPTETTVPGVDPASFHPTARGQRAYAEAVSETRRSS